MKIHLDLHSSTSIHQSPTPHTALIDVRNCTVHLQFICIQLSDCSHHRLLKGTVAEDTRAGLLHCPGCFVPMNNWSMGRGAIGVARHSPPSGSKINQPIEVCKWLRRAVIWFWFLLPPRPGALNLNAVVSIRLEMQINYTLQTRCWSGQRAWD